MTRRNFTLALGAAGSALSASNVLGANDKVRTALIGAGGRGSQDWETFLAEADFEPVAVCDVYTPFRDRAIQTAKGKPSGHHDFRQVLERKDVDAVIVATPDHWHAAITVAACNAGKDVYCEKPLSLTVAEGRKMLAAARKNNRVVQTGSQQRSGAHYAQAVQLIREGGLGDVHRIHAGFQRNIYPGLKPAEFDAAKLDWDFWLGPAPKVAFDPFRAIYNFRWFWDYSGGQMTNWGAHHLDIARWILNADAPTTVSGTGGRYSLTDGGETPDLQQVSYQFPKAVVTWTASEASEGKGVTLDICGTKGTMTLLRNGYKVVPEQWPVSPGSKERKPAMKAIEVKGGDLDHQHARNFLDCVKSRKRPNADIEEGHRSAVMAHLGNISTRLGRTLTWDPVNEKVVNDTEANKWLDKAYRGNWKLV